MNYKIVTYPAFEREFKRLAKKYKSLKTDMLSLRDELMLNPMLGVDLGGGVRKVRMQITSKGKGKSGGARVITMLIQRSEDLNEVGLHYIFDKSELENITDKELSAILKKNGVI